jgi:hypothetical protein
VPLDEKNACKMLLRPFFNFHFKNDSETTIGLNKPPIHFFLKKIHLKKGENPRD